jgi:ubiquinol-cytochrome c reductase cytochrome b subunit
VAYAVTKRVCLGLQRRDSQTLEHGVETGIVRQLPDGGFIEAVRPVTERERAVLAARPAPGALPAPDAGGVPAPGGAGVLGRLRTGLNAAYTETAAAATEANGHADDSKHQPVDGPGELPASETHREASSTSDPDRSA